MSIPRRDFVKLGCFLGGLGVCVRESRADTQSDEKKQTLEQLWANLEKSDPEAARALLALSMRAKEIVPLLATELKPLRVDPDWLAVRLERLGSKEDDVWKPAFEELEYFDPRLSKTLEDLMNDVTKNPARSRLAEILSERDPDSLKGKDVKLNKFGGKDGKPVMFNFVADNGSWWAEASIEKINTAPWGSTKKKWTRAVRAIALLEHFGTPEAQEILKSLTTGDPDAQPTRVAKESLSRLG